MRKSAKRAERRWRSFCVWTRRLQSKWWEYEGLRKGARAAYLHWKRDPDGYREEYSEDGYRGRELSYFRDFSRPGVHVLKDHPTGTMSARRSKTLWERRRLRHSDLKKLHVERDLNRGRKRRLKGKVQARIQCACGYFLGWDTVEPGRLWETHWRARGSWSRSCRDCRRRQILNRNPEFDNS